MMTIKLLLGLLLWVLLVVPVLLLTALAWLLTPLAVKRAKPYDVRYIIYDQNVSRMTLRRFQLHPLTKAYRLPWWARWLMELHDDQLLPPGRYEPAMREHQGDWQRQSIEMLRRNPGQGLDNLLAMPTNMRRVRLKLLGTVPGERSHGVWLIQIGLAWQLKAQLPLTKTRELGLNWGWLLNDHVEGHAEFDAKARYRLPVVRLSKRPQAPCGCILCKMSGG